eukprot:1136453-Pelagomonas_calceolata.AAC.1
MEGAAQGGQIVCEQDVAMRAAEAWAATQPSAQPEQAIGTPLHTVQSNWSPFQSLSSSYLGNCSSFMDAFIDLCLPLIRVQGSQFTANTGEAAQRKEAVDVIGSKESSPRHPPAASLHLCKEGITRSYRMRSLNFSPGITHTFLRHVQIKIRMRRKLLGDWL